MSVEYSPNTVSSIISENELTYVLSKFDSDYILDMITCQLNTMTALNYSSNKINAIFSLDTKYKDECLKYFNNPEIINGLKADRFESYMEIIDFISNYFNIDVDRGNIMDDNIYFLTYYMYDLFVHYYTNMVNFFVSYILKNKSNIYEMYDLAQYKKDKDSSTLYNKKVYVDSKLAIIVSHLESIIRNIANLDITFDEYLKTIYNDEPNVVISILSYIRPRDNYFKNMIYKILNDINSNLTLISDVRMQLSNYSTVNITIEDYMEEGE